MARTKKEAVANTVTEEVEIKEVKVVLQDEIIEEGEDDSETGLKIPLDGRYMLTSDKYQYILNRRGWNEKKGEETLTSIGYYQTVEQAINDIAEMELRKRTAKSIQELIKNSADIKEYIKEMYRGIDEKVIR